MSDLDFTNPRVEFKMEELRSQKVNLKARLQFRTKELGLPLKHRISTFLSQTWSKSKSPVYPLEALSTL